MLVLHVESWSSFIGFRPHRMRKDPEVYVTRWLTFWMPSSPVAATFLSMIDALYGFVSQPQRLKPDRAGNVGESAKTHTYTLRVSLSLALWQNGIEQSDGRDGVKAQCSDSDSLWRTLLVSFPVVVETCWDFLSNQTRAHQRPLAWAQCGETTHLIPSPHWKKWNIGAIHSKYIFTLIEWNMVVFSLNLLFSLCRKASCSLPGQT